MLSPRPPAPSSTFTRLDARRLGVAAVLLIAAMTAIFALDLVRPRLEVAVGTVASTNIVAPRADSYPSAIETAKRKAEASQAVANVYDFSDEKADRIAAAAALAFDVRVRPIDNALKPDVSAEDKAALLATVDGLTEPSRTALAGLDLDGWTKVREQASAVLDATERNPVKDTEVETTKAGLSTRIIGLDRAGRTLAVELIAPLVQPNSSFSSELTNAARAKAASEVPTSITSYAQDETIVLKGQKITPEILEAIEWFGLTEARPDLARLGGWFLMSTLIIGILLGWVWRFRRQLWHRTNALVLIGLIVVATTFLLKLTAGRQGLPFILPTAAAGMLLAILLDSGVAVIVVGMLALLGGAVNGTTGSLELTAYIFLGGLAGIVAIRRGDRFQVFIQAGLAVAIVNVLVVATFGFLGLHDARGVIELMAASLLSAAGSAVAAVGTFAVLGSVFGILTVFQLLELANPSQPLLRRLLVETPGTYHHSLMVGNLAERAAEAIGADPLLTRVAAYYHDIGKLSNPLGFIENQAGGENIHDQLEPETSAQILKQHTADGIDIAYKAKLPKGLIAFIPQHHGTAIMSYFFARAKGNAAEPYGGPQTADGAKAAAAVDERRFRHSGPKPQTREAALIMLADGVEASVRSLASRDEPAIRAMVARIIDERMSDGQFDECDLTLRDVEKIKEAFVQQLLGMYHQRIAYPQNTVIELESRRGTGTGAGA
ncbi:MAG TPA: HDIG domain-containing protein [Patescibacteria group bacterium]|nr:HDIG domain-containing protein [Patescibacteria group bacterium]